MKKQFLLSFFTIMIGLSSQFAFGQLTAPSNLVATRVTGSTSALDLTWTDNSTGELGTDISMSLSPTGPFNWKIGAPANATSVRVTGLSPGVTYYFVASAYGPAGTPASAYSNVASQSTNVTMPNPASNAQVTNITQTSALLTWADNTSGPNSESGFEILRSIDGGTFTRIAMVGANVTSYQDNSLLMDNYYRYRVFPFNSAGTPGNSPADSPIFFTLPSSPQSLIGTLYNLTDIWLYWTDNSSTENLTLVERSSDDGKTWVWVGDAPKNSGYFRDRTAQEGIRYLYRTKFRNQQGESPYSNVVAVTTRKKVPSNAPYLLTAKPLSTTSIYLQWVNPDQDITNTMSEIEVWRYTEDNAYAERIGVINPVHYFFTDTTAKPKTKYIYVVHGNNPQGKSPASNAATATTLGPPYAPSNLAVTPKQDAIGTNVLWVTWKDNSDDEWGFTVERSTDKDFKTNVYKGDVLQNVTSLTSTPIEEGVTYYFRAKGSNKYGDSKYSDVVTVTTAVSAVPNAPFALRGTAKAEEVTLMWSDDSNSEETFEVERSTDGTTFAKVGSVARNVVKYVDNTAKEKTKYSYRVKGVNSKGSSAYSNVFEITTPAKTAGFVSNEIQAADSWEVYPNPTADFVKISLTTSQRGTISVLDKSSREVSRIILNGTEEEYKVDLSNLPEGTYTISLRTETSQQSKRVYKY